MATKFKLTPIWIAAIGVGAALAAWIAFHPYRRAELKELTPAHAALVEQKLFGSAFDTRIRKVKMLSELSDGAGRMGMALEQEHAVPRPGVALRTTHYYLEGNSSAVQAEYTRLTVGPLVLLSHERHPLPIVGDLLPFSFWTTTRMRDLVIRENAGFPQKPGGSFAASYVMDELHTDGTLAQSIGETIDCAVTGTRAAASIFATLKGDAGLYECVTKTAKTKEYAEESRTEVAYFPELAWSFGLTQTVTNNATTSKRQFKNTLLQID